MRDIAQVLRRGLKGLYRSRLPQMAAALSFRTIFGLIPTMVVAIVVVKAFTTDEDMRTLIERTLHYTGLSQIVVDHEGDETAGEESAARLDAWIQERVTLVANIKLGAIGLVGGLFLIYAAISMLVEVERSFNQVYRAPLARGWVRRITQYWTVLTLGAVFLAATFFVGQKFRGLVDTSFAFGLVGYVVTVAISALLLVLMYSLIPNTRTHLRSALAGALIAAVLWEAGKWGFTRYISYSTRYQQLYGSLAIVPLFLLWVYVTWLIVLFGLQVSYGLQMLASGLVGDNDGDRPRLIDPAFVLAVLAKIVENFREGKTTTADEIAEAAGLDPDAIEPILERLREASCIHAIPEANDELRYVLARPAEQIAIADALGGMYELGRFRADGPAAEIIGRLREAQRREASRLTAADLVPRAEPGSRGTSPAAAPAT